MHQQLSVWATTTYQFSFSAEQIFDSWFDLQIMQDAFFGSNLNNAELISGQLEPFVGGFFAYIATLNGVNRSHNGEYLEIRKPNRLVFTWQANSIELPTSKIFIDIVDNPDGATIFLSHELPYYWVQLVKQAEKAWLQLLVDFEQVLIHKGY